MRHFLFLEFLDPRVLGFLNDLRDSLQNSTSSSPIHITLRGPYRSPPDPAYMIELSQKLRGYGVRINGAGSFSTSTGFSVFLRAESSVFRDLWWKPDFPASKREIQPHLTVFESTNKDAAKRVLDFLRSSRISILTYSVQLSVYTTGQASLFGTTPVETMPPNRANRRDLIAIDPGLLKSARDLGVMLAHALD